MSLSRLTSVFDTTFQKSLSSNNIFILNF
jgi:hypothetical protein